MLELNSLMLLSIVSCRMAGVVFFNPIFGRRNIPGIAKMGLSLGIAFNAVHMLNGISVIDYSAIEMILSMLKEFAVGYAMGFVVQLFLSIFHLGGELIDLQLGISMGSLYDPTSNSQISINGNLITIMYTLLFFITNSHITLLGIAIKSFQVVPIGLIWINSEITLYVIELFAYILIYAVQLALPVIITEIIVEVAVGILMRVVPNINVFVVNLQLKLGIGMIVILTIIPVLVKYLGKLNMLMLESLEEILLFF
ncbi:MAG: flagellar biosynthetic protein FliR [Eubacteriales bacterium]|nr:flagellar biosynthetic protein FliR [Eubacteriales bacterium]